MEITITILLSILILLILWNILSSRKQRADPALSMMQQEILNLRRQLSENLAVNIQTINQQLG
ncbi:MAG: hypothetical protein AAB256_01035, partial [Deltaproteobacteria bacterium]